MKKILATNATLIALAVGLAANTTYARPHGPPPEFGCLAGLLAADIICHAATPPRPASVYVAPTVVATSAPVVATPVVVPAPVYVEPVVVAPPPPPRPIIVPIAPRPMPPPPHHHGPHAAPPRPGPAGRPHLGH